MRGSERDLVVDAANGIGPLRPAIDALSDGRPVVAVVTHAHFDHVGGLHEFEDRRCHRADAEMPTPAGLRLMREDFPAWLVEDFEYYDSPIPETVAVSGVPDRDFDPAGWTTPSATATSFVDEGDVDRPGRPVVRRAPYPWPHGGFDLPVGRRERNDLHGRRDLRRRAGSAGRIRRRSPLRSCGCGTWTFASSTAATGDRSMRSSFVRRWTRHWRRWARTAAIPASESSIRGQQTLRELACQDRHAAGRATSHPGCLSTHPRSSACAVGPERAPDDATPCIPLGPIGSLSGRPFRPAITDDVGAGKDTGAAAIAMRAVDDRPERKPVRTTFQVSVIARPCGIARWSGFGPRPSGGQRRYARRLWANA